MGAIYKVARAGKTTGEFDLLGLKEALEKGQLQWTDDYWKSGMPNWAKLESIRAEILAAQRQSPPPPLPKEPIGKVHTQKEKNDLIHGLLLAMGIMSFAIGGLTLLSGLAGNPDGSAIRHGVLMQQMTNGILLMILGVLLAKN